MNKKLPRWNADDWSGASFFDLDRTLLEGNSSYHFGAYLFKHGQISFCMLVYLLLCYTLYACRCVSIEAMQHAIFKKLFEGVSAPKMRAWAQAFVASRLERLLCLSAVEEMKRAKSSGHFTAILSSSPDFLVEPIASVLGVHDWQATRYAVDEQARFSHIDTFFLGEEKAAYVKSFSCSQQIEKSRLIAYSDSVLDLPLLEAVGQAVGVNPDRPLRKICKNRQWMILEG